MKTTKQKIKESILPIIGVGLSAYFLKSSLSTPDISTHSYRENLIKHGVNLKGKDIDHIVPKNLGGINHPLNYQVVDSSVNRSWQDGNLVEKASLNPMGMLGGIIISYLVPPIGIALSLYGGYKCTRQLIDIWDDNDKKLFIKYHKLLIDEQKKYGRMYEPNIINDFYCCPVCNEKLVEIIINDTNRCFFNCECGYEYAFSLEGDLNE